MLFANATHNAEQEPLYFNNQSGANAQARGDSGALLSLRSSSPNAVDTVSLSFIQDRSQYLPALHDDSTRVEYAKQHALLVALLNSTEKAVYKMPSAGSLPIVNAPERPLFVVSISLNACGPHDPPVIDYNSLGNPVDGVLAVTMLKLTRRCYDTLTMLRLSPVEVVPWQNCSGTEDLFERLQWWGLFAFIRSPELRLSNNAAGVRQCSLARTARV